MALILLSEVSLNPGPVNRHQTKYHKSDVFNTKGFHFIHRNINSLLHKIGKLRYIVNYYVRKNIWFNLKTCLSSKMKNIFIDLFFPKTEPISNKIILEIL